MEPPKGDCQISEFPLIDGFGFEMLCLSGVFLMKHISFFDA